MICGYCLIFTFSVVMISHFDITIKSRRAILSETYDKVKTSVRDELLKCKKN